MSELGPSNAYRLSPDQANEFLGHHPESGEVTQQLGFAYFTVEYGQFFEDEKEIEYYHPGSVVGNSISDKLLGSEEVANIHAEDLDHENLYRYIDQMRILDSVNTLVASCAKDHGNDDRKKFIAEAYANFQSGFPDSEDQPWQDNFDQTIAFLQFYENLVVEAISDNSWVEKVNEWRTEYVDFLGQPDARTLFDEATTARVARAVRAAPIKILDPIRVLVDMQAENRETDYFGMFSHTNRTIYIDPLTIRRNMLYTTIPLDFGMKGTLFHELTHAVSTSYYRLEEYGYVDLSDHEDDTTQERFLRGQRLWPAFWEEGMAEKIANFIEGSMASPEDLDRPQQLQTARDGEQIMPIDQEVIHRSRTLTNNPKEALVTTAASELRKITPASYPAYRLVIDAFFEKLDWESASLSREQAETLAAHAFTESPGDPTSNRINFMHAVNMASHPGFFMKLHHAVEIHGEKIVTDLLLSKDFDPHDPRALPFTTTRQFLGHLRDATRSADNARQRLAQFRALGAPAWMIAETETKLQEHSDNAERFPILQQAVAAERAQLKAASGRFLFSALDLFFISERYGSDSEEYRAAFEQFQANQKILKNAARYIRAWINSIPPEQVETPKLTDSR